MTETGQRPRVFYDINFTISIFSFLKGDMFIVHNELEDGWMWVTNLRTDEQGLIVEDLVEEVVSFMLFLRILNIFKILRQKTRKKKKNLEFPWWRSGNESD